jgi:apolipoprotein N-acyltransferase
MGRMVDDVIAGPAQAPAPVAAADRAAAPDGAFRLGGWAAIAAAVAGGLILTAAFPPINLWWLAPVGVALLALATLRRGAWAGAGLGLLTGLSLLVPLLSWTGRYVGSVWFYLPVGESAYFALMGAASALVTPLVLRWRFSWPLLTGALWVGQEALRDRTPFGGFPWGRLAFSQADSPLLRLASLGGAPLVTFGVAAAGGFLAVAVVQLRRVRATAAIALAAAVLVIMAPLAVPLAAAGGRAVTVAVVQGNVPRLGLDFNAQRRAVLDNHVNATLKLAADVKAGRTPQPDLVIWPENASDIDPIANADASARIDDAAAAIGVPILVGGLLDGPGDHLRNAGMVWEPGKGVTQTYIKQHPVPFAEYMPLRSLIRHLSSKVDQVREDFLPGDKPGVLTMGPARVGDVICFEVAYDDVVGKTVDGGAQLLVVQTNNATFTNAEAQQQLAMVRLRAVEHGRDGMMASTVGVSAFVTSTGTVSDATSFDTAATIVNQLHLSDGRTIATELGAIPEFALAFAALVAVVAAVAMRRANRKDRRETDEEPATDRGPSA